MAGGVVKEPVLVADVFRLDVTQTGSLCPKPIEAALKGQLQFLARRDCGRSFAKFSCRRAGSTMIVPTPDSELLAY